MREIREVRENPSVMRHPASRIGVTYPRGARAIREVRETIWLKQTVLAHIADIADR
jgi:hypothetical protein